MKDSFIVSTGNQILIGGRKKEVIKQLDHLLSKCSRKNQTLKEMLEERVNERKEWK